MAKVRVPILGTVGKSVRVDPDATVGGTLGTNLFDANGSLLSFDNFITAEQLQAIIISGGAGVSDHGLLTGLADDDHPQYPRHAFAASITGIWNFSTQPTGINHASLNLLSADDHAQYALLAGRAGGQTLNGGLVAGESLILRGSSSSPDSGIIEAQSPIELTYDTFSNTTPAQQFMLRWAPTFTANAAYIGGALQVAPTVTISTATFIPATFSDTSNMLQAATPGFSAFTFINELAVIRNSGNFNLMSALVMNIGLTHERNSVGTSTTPGTTGVSFAAQTRATVSGAVMTKTSQTAVRCSPTFSTVAGATVNLGTIRGLHCFNPAVALFQPGAGAEAMTAYYGVDVEAIPFGGNVAKVALRSGLTFATGSRFLQNNGNAISEMGTGHTYFDDDGYIGFGGAPLASDILLGWVGAGSYFRLYFASTADSLRFTSPAADRFLIDNDGGSTTGEYNFNCARFSMGAQTGAVGNQVGVFVAGTRTTSVGGDWSDFLLTQAGNITVDAAIGTLAAWTINAPSITLGSGSVSTAVALNVGGNPGVATVNRIGLRIISNPSGGSGVNAALWCTVGLAQFDGGVTLGGGAVLRIFDALNTDSGAFSHDGADFNMAFVNTARLNITGVTRIRVSGRELITDLADTFLRINNASNYATVFIPSPFRVDNQFRISNTAGSDFATFSHDGTDFNTAFIQTADWNIGSGLTNGVRVVSDIGFYNTAPVAQPTVTGSRGANAALASLLTGLAGQGLIIDNTVV